jgi:hypothetical protein
LNIIENKGRFLEIHSHINYEAVKILERETTDRTEFIQFSNNKTIKVPGYILIEPNNEDIKIINSYFKFHKNIFFRWIENWWLPLLPELEKFMFLEYDREAINLIKNNKVTALIFENSPDKKYNLDELFIFKNTLEELSINGNYKNLEIMLNEMKQLNRLSLRSVKFDFEKINQNDIEYLFCYGSKTRDFDGIIKLNKLKHLNIANNMVLENLDFLSALNDLEIIELGYCSKIKKFPNLEHLKKIKKISLQECKNIENLNELKKLKHIEIINVINGVRHNVV